MKGPGQVGQHDGFFKTKYHIVEYTPNLQNITTCILDSTCVM